MKIERLIDLLNDTNIYIIIDEDCNNTIVIDPSDFNLVDTFLQSYGLRIEYIILTHEHVDHILGVNELIEKYKCSLIASKKCNSGITNSKTNLSSFFEVLWYYKKNFKGEQTEEYKKVEPYICRAADIVFEGNKMLIWNNHMIEFQETPGHSKGSICITIDNYITFSGDSLLKDVEVITRFPGGNRKVFDEITLPFYRTLPKDTQVYPGHGEKFKLKEKVKI